MQFLTYENLTYRVRISYPSEWTLLENQLGTVVIFLAPLQGPSDKYRENLNIVVQNLSDQPMTLEEYSELSLNQLDKVITAFNVVEPLVSRSLSDSAAKKIVFNGLQGKFYLRYVQTWTIKDNIAYMLSFISEEIHYHEYLTIIKKMVESFRILQVLDLE